MPSIYGQERTRCVDMAEKQGKKDIAFQVTMHKTYKWKSIKNVDHTTFEPKVGEPAKVWDEKSIEGLSWTKILSKLGWLLLINIHNQENEGEVNTVILDTDSLATEASKKSWKKNYAKL